MKATASQSVSAYVRIRDAVAAGEFAMGTPLTENQLADFVGASRTPVREAVHRLELEGLLVREDRGLMVPDPGPDEIFEIFETRAILSSASARLAAERRTQLDLSALKEYLADAKASADAPLKRRLEIQSAFMTACWRACHNRTLVAELTRMGTPSIHFGGSTTLDVPGQWPRLVAYFEAVLDAIMIRDADQAGSLTWDNVMSFRDARLRLWRERHRAE